MMVEARNEGPEKNATLGPLRVQPLNDSGPAPLKTGLKPVRPFLIEKLEGWFMIINDRGIGLYHFDDRLFASTVGFSLPDVELFLDPDGSLVSPLVDVAFQPVVPADGPAS